MLVFLYRVWSFAWQNFWRNIGLSLITILVLLMNLVSFDVIFAVRGITNNAIKIVENKVNVSLIFKTDAPDEKIKKIQDDLKVLPEVASLTYKDRDQVLLEFKDRHKDNSEVLAALDELDGNPLGATLTVTARDTKDYDAILKVMDDDQYKPIIEKKTYENQGPIIKKINTITTRTQQAGLILAGILTIVAFLIIFNVIRLGIQSHGEEIGIMKLVGATNSFVRLPFLIDVLLYSLFTWLINLGLLYGAMYFAEPFLRRFFDGTDFSLWGYFNEHFLIFFGAELLGLIALGLVSSGLAMRRYLKV